MPNAPPASRRASSRRAGAGDGLFRAGNDANARFFRQSARGSLVAKQLQQRRGRAYEGDAGPFTRARKGGIFRQKTVAWVNGVYVLFLGQGNDTIHIEVSLDGAHALAHQVGFVGFEAVQAEAIFFGINGYGPQAKLGGGAHDTDSDFATIEGEKLLHAGDFRISWNSVEQRLA